MWRSHSPLSEMRLQELQVGDGVLPETGTALSTAEAPSVPRKPRRLIMKRVPSLPETLQIDGAQASETLNQSRDKTPIVRATFSDCKQRKFAGSGASSIP